VRFVARFFSSIVVRFYVVDPSSLIAFPYVEFFRAQLPDGILVYRQVLQTTQCVDLGDLSDGYITLSLKIRNSYFKPNLLCVRDIKPNPEKGDSSLNKLAFSHSLSLAMLSRWVELP